MRNSVLCGVGSFLPNKVVSNDDLSRIVDTTDEWVFRRTGIKNRHLVEDGQTTSEMATEAARLALQDSGIKEDEVDLIVVATTTPDRTLPSCATMVQGKLGCTGAFAFDINAACSGFVYAISVVDSMIKANQVDVALIIGAEAMSRIVDWRDRATCVLFGDGAGAVVLKGSTSDAGVISTTLNSDGSLGDILCTDGGVCTTGNSGYICMKGTVVFEHAVTKLISSISELLNKSSIDIDEVDWLVPHQANVRIVDLVTKKLKFPQERVILSIRDHANTSAASIPLAMNEAKRQGKFKKGDLILLAGIGAGLTWGASLIRL